MIKNFIQKHIVKFITITLVIGLVFVYSIFQSVETKSIGENNKLVDFQYSNINIDVNLGLFNRAINEVDTHGFKIDGRVVGAILPHHDLAGDMIAEFLSILADHQLVERFIILAPNHHDIAIEPAISTLENWQTHLGQVETDQKNVEQLAINGLIAYDPENFQMEHSIKVLLPFIEYYFPQAKVVPIIFTSQQTNQASFLLAENIFPLLDGKTVVINSLDLSHYLPLNQAEINDQLTLAAINNKNYELINSLNSDYLDSPDSLNTMLKVMELSKASEMKIISHTNSANILNVDLDSTTSYITSYFVVND